MLTGTLVAAAVSTAGVACETDTVGPDAGAQPAEVQEGVEPELEGREVAVSGRVTGLLNEHAFLLTGDDFDGVPTLVLSERPVDVEDGLPVQVEGTVREVVVDSFQQDFGFDFQSAVFGEYAGSHAIDASSVQVIEPDGG